MPSANLTLSILDLPEKVALETLEIVKAAGYGIKVSHDWPKNGRKGGDSPLWLCSISKDGKNVWGRHPEFAEAVKRAAGRIRNA